MNPKIYYTVLKFLGRPVGLGFEYILNLEKADKQFEVEIAEEWKLGLHLKQFGFNNPDKVY